MKLPKKGLVGLVIAALIVASVIIVALPRTEFQVSNLTITPKEVLVGNLVIVSADIRNAGRRTGDYRATLIINGSVQETKSLNVPAQSTQSASFTFTPTSPGEYKVILGGLTTTFIVREGVLPILYQGDWWQYKVSALQDKSEVTYEVLGEGTFEGKVVYVVQSIGKTLPDPHDKGISLVDKEILYADFEERSGTVEGITVSWKVTVVDRQVQGTRWSLEVGKEWSVSWTENLVTKKGLVLSAEERKVSRNFKVEGIENVTVAAGDFRCFKVVERDGTGNIVGTYWYSDNVKREVRYVLKLQNMYVNYELVFYHISTTPPATTPPKLEVFVPTDYKEPTFGYSISYPEGWELATTGEGEEQAVEVFTSGGAGGVRFAYLNVRVISNVGETSLDEVYEQILESTKKGDPSFELVGSLKVLAELPWYEIEWRSPLKEVQRKGKTILALEGEQLFVVTGWVQEAYSEEYWSALEKVMGSFGISPQR